MISLLSYLSGSSNGPLKLRLSGGTQVSSNKSIKTTTTTTGESVMMKAVATAAETAERAAPGQAPVQPLYLEALTLVERLHRRLLDVIKDEFDRRGRSDINSVQALLLYNIGDKELTAGGLGAPPRLLSRLQRLLQSEEAGRARFPRSPALARRSSLGPHSPDPAGPGDPPHRRCALSEARQDGRAGRRHLERGVRDAEQVAASPRTVLDPPDPVQ